jgi:adenylate cyclase
LVRRLAAILAADIVGYSRLMRDDEEGTLARLKALRRELFEPRVSARNGRIVKTTGDGALVEFASAVDAVRCAVDIQQGLAERAAEAAEGTAMSLRIGINLGDVIIDDGDIYGDGVNVAARLEAIAEPGDIYLASSVEEQVRHKLSLECQDLGEHELKNIAGPVQVFRVALGSTKDPAVARKASVHAKREKPSIAVLPFDNMSGDPEQDYLADGISEDLITGLSKIRWFFVIARNSTFTYKGQAVEVTKVARELGVRYVLEGSVRKAGKRVRVTAQLIDATSGRHVWAERYDRQIEDIFDLQDEMTLTIVGAVEPELSAAEREEARGKPPDNMDAWAAYQQGLWHMWSYKREESQEAKRLLAQARTLDPNFSTAFAYESYNHYQNVIMGWSASPQESLAQGLIAAKRALACDDKDPAAYFALGRIHMMQGNHDASIAALETAISLNPSFAQAYHGLGMAQTLAGLLEEAKEAQDMAARLSPRDPILWATTVVHALACILSHDDEEALDWAERTLRMPRSQGYWPHAVHAAALANLDRVEEARDAIAAALEAMPDLTLSYVEKTLPTKQKGGLARYLDGLRKAGLPD